MKWFEKYKSTYLMIGFILFFVVVYMVSLVFINDSISGGSSVEIYKKQLEKERQMKKN